MYDDMRPDIVATDDAGNAYVFEIKASRDRRATSFSDLAQVKTYERAIRNAFPGKTIRAVFVTNGEISDTIQDLSGELGILLLDIDGPTELSSKVESLLAEA